jgi:hypothetical protein
MDPLIAILLIIFVILIGWGFWYVITENTNSGNTGTTGDLGEVPPPLPPQPLPGYEYTLQFINKTNQTILLGALGPSLPIGSTELSVPNEKWTIPSGKNILVGIPSNWLGPNLNPGPRFWARTGCRYNAQTGFAQCESGGCNLNYDCNLAGDQPASLAEFCFNCGQYGDEVVYDVSLVDGYNLSIDIIPIGASSANPHNPNDDHWNITGICDGDLRAICPTGSYQLRSSNLSSYIPGNPDNIVGCFSNCGFAAYYNQASGPEWEKYCCQQPSPACTGSTGCENGTVCWSPNGQNNTCQCHGWIAGATCATNVCTFASEAAPYSQCTDGCIGDDTFHSICPYAFSWPNENQNQTTNAKVFQIVFGQATTSPITPTGPIPACTSLPSEFNPSTNIELCGTNLGKYSGAHKTTDNPSNWDCNIELSGNTTGVLCSN